MKKYISAILLLTSVLLSGQAIAELKDFSGKPQSLSDYTTSPDLWTVVIFWKSDCHACNVEAEQYIQFHENNKQTRMLGISMDGQQGIEEARAFIKRHAVTYPNLIGEFVEVAQMYESLTGGEWIGTPTILVYDPQGTLQAAQPGAVPVELIEEFILSRSSTGQTETPRSGN